MKKSESDLLQGCSCSSTFESKHVQPYFVFIGADVLFVQVVFQLMPVITVVCFAANCCTATLSTMVLLFKSHHVFFDVPHADEDHLPCDKMRQDPRILLSCIGQTDLAVQHLRLLEEQHAVESVLCFLLSQQHGVLKIVQLGGVPLFGVVFCVVVVGQERQSNKSAQGIGVHAQWHLDCWRVLVGAKLSRACVDTSAFPLAQQLRCVTIVMSRVVCASTCTTRTQVASRAFFHVFQLMFGSKFATSSIWFVNHHLLAARC